MTAGAWVPTVPTVLFIVICTRQASVGVPSCALASSGNDPRSATRAAMAAQQQSLEMLLGIATQRKSLKQQLDSAYINVEIGRTTLADLPTVQIGCKRYIPEEYIANKIAKAGGAGFKPTGSSSLK